VHLLKHQGPRTIIHRDEETGRRAGHHVDHADGRRDAVVTPPLKRVEIHASDFGMTVPEMTDLLRRTYQTFPDKPATQSGLLLPGGFL
jgi:hypothetical protein